MPELAEVEAYRRLAEERALGRPISEVDAPDAWYLKGGLTAQAVQRALVGRSLVGAERRGKLLMLPTGGPTSGPTGGSAADRPDQDQDEGPTLGLRFGMSGRLLVDGTAGMDDLWYSSNREETRWDRFTIRFSDGGSLAMRDPRRLGGVSLEPDLSRLGPDALTVTLPEFRRAMGTAGASSLKARLLDQSRLAGVGNLAADEVLWRAKLAPGRAAASLGDAELRRLHRHLRAILAEFIERGGSHTGQLMAERRPGGVCPKDATPLVHGTIATRSTWWCPTHQT